MTTKTVVVVTILLLVASWIYPPWILHGGSHGWFFVFDTTHNIVMRVDFGRLLLIDAIIVAAGALLAWTVFHSSTGRRAAVRIAFYTLVVAPMAAVICLGIILIQNVHHEVAKRAAQTKRFDSATATLVDPEWTPPEVAAKSKAWPPYDALITYLAKKQPVTVEIPGHGIAEFPAGMSSDEIAAVIKKQFFSAEAQKAAPTSKLPDHDE